MRIESDVIYAWVFCIISVISGVPWKTPLYHFLSNSALLVGETHHPSAPIKAT